MNNLALELHALDELACDLSPLLPIMRRGDLLYNTSNVVFLGPLIVMVDIIGKKGNKCKVISRKIPTFERIENRCN